MKFRNIGAFTLLVSSTSIVYADFDLTILHTNDIHSRIESINKYNSTCNAEGEAEDKCFGGMARIKTKMDELREQMGNQNVLVLDAGDPFQGSLFYTTYKGEAEAEFMESIGYDAMAVGNHEFDDGPEGLAKFVDAVSFPVLSGNLDLSDEASLAGKVEDHLILEVGGEKIGIISALATDTVDTSSPGDNVVFQDEIEALTADVAALEAAGVNKIIALNHVGLPKDLEIAEAVPGIDVVIGGHSHTLMTNDEDSSFRYPTMVGSTPVAQAYAYSKFIGKLTVSFDDEGNVTAATGDPVILDSSVTPNAEMAARITEMGAPIEEMKKRIVAKTADVVDGDRGVCRVAECSMGNLVADAMLDRVKDQGVTIAIQNGGGLRASIDAGEVTMGEVLTVLPFQNTLATFQASGQTIIDALENGVSQVEEVKGRFPQVAGLKFTWDASVAPNEGRIQEVMVIKDGDYQAIDPMATYSVATNDYVRNGGDGYKMFKDAENAYDYGPDLADVTAEFLAAQGDYAPYTDGRIAKK